MTKTEEKSNVATPVTPLEFPAGKADLTTSSLGDLEGEEQRRILDTVERVRRCGLDSILSLPQLVVCGDQSAGKSSVLEALTEIPFPRNDNLCTRFATEISLRRSSTNLLTIKVIPDEKRASSEQAAIKAFKEVITEFSDLPDIMDKAMGVMGISKDPETDKVPRAFSRDVLSIIIEGPSRPQLTLVDIPGLIATHTKGTTSADVELVAEITDHYISQHRTICLPVIAATADFANQKIIDKVRQVDPKGSRTLGIITKPDRLEKGSGLEKSFLQLARNKNIEFDLGWHVLKNRSFEQRDFDLEERHMAEDAFLRTSIFNGLPAETLGIDNLRQRLSVLLFEHIKKELPRLQKDLEIALHQSKKDLEVLGSPRSTVPDCRIYLTNLSVTYRDICMAAVNGHYGASYFQGDTDGHFSLSNPSSIRRTRAVVQRLNAKFSENLRNNGHKFQIDVTDPYDELEDEEEECDGAQYESNDKDLSVRGVDCAVGVIPVKLSEKDALKWIRNLLEFTRGKELPGSFNPLLVGELFWQQSSNWHQMAETHINTVSIVCTNFVKTLLQDKCPKDVMDKIWVFKVQDTLNIREREARKELGKLKKDLAKYPINYNNYYTTTINKRRQNRLKAALKKSINETTDMFDDKRAMTNTFDVDKVVDIYAKGYEGDMEKFACQEALDSLFAIYKVFLKTFIANVTIQVIERHLVDGLEHIFSPETVINLSDAEVLRIASEKSTTKRLRDRLEDQISKLEEGKEIFKSVV